MTEAEVRDIAGQNGIVGFSLTPHPSVGVDNHIWFLGPDLLLRTAKDETAAGYMRGELEVWPFVQTHGVKVPELIAIGEREGGLPYMIVRRVHGRLLGECPADSDLSAFIEEFVEQLALIHKLPVQDKKWHRPFDYFDPWPYIRSAREKQLLSPEDLSEIEDFAKRLQEYPGNFVGEVGDIRHTPADVLTHNDLHPWNIMVSGDEPRLVSLLDWGDSCVSDRRNDLCSLPLSLQIRIAETYREEVGLAGEGFEARCLWGWLDMSLWEVRDLVDREFVREWWRWPVGGWSEVKSILQQAPSGWRI